MFQAITRTIPTCRNFSFKTSILQFFECIVQKTAKKSLQVSKNGKENNKKL